MASPTEDEIQSQIGLAIKLLDETVDFGSSNTPNVASMVDACIEAAEGDWTGAAGAALEAWRARLSSLLAPQECATILLPHWLAYAKLNGYPETDAISIIRRLYRTFADGSKRVKSRVFSFGSISAGGSNVGTGTINRLTKDAYNHDIENQTADVKTFECVEDEHTGASEHEERFEIRGQAAYRDLLSFTGSGERGVIRAVSSRGAEQYFNNPSFDTFEGSGASITSIPGWTVGTNIANFEEVTSSYYRDAPGVTTAKCVKFETNDSLEQNFNVRPAIFDPGIPVYVQIAYNRQTGSGDGTLTLTFGNVTANVVLAAQTGWNILRIAIGANAWHKNFNKDRKSVV